MTGYQNCVHDRHARILVCASGNPEELSWYGEVVAYLLKFRSKADIRCVAPTRPEGCPPECWIEYWPAADLYPTADVVVGGAGYNTIYECEAYKIPLVVLNSKVPENDERRDRHALKRPLGFSDGLIPAPIAGPYRRNGEIGIDRTKRDTGTAA